MQTDSQLQQAVIDELQWEPSIDCAHIGVTAKNGVVTLSGFVPNYAQKLTAERAARRVRGVKAIAEEIDVRLPYEALESDDTIAERTLNVLKWNVRVPDAIKVKVEDGLVTLTGEVEWRFQMDEAVAAVRRLAGVRGVSNLLQVNAKTSSGDVRERIRSAFQRSSALDANTIDVSVDDGTVRLSGQVKGWNERQVAEHAAWSAPGVRRVVDNIVLT